MQGERDKTLAIEKHWRDNGVVLEAEISARERAWRPSLSGQERAQFVSHFNKVVFKVGVRYGDGGMGRRTRDERRWLVPSPESEKHPNMRQQHAFLACLHSSHFSSSNAINK